MTPDNNSQPQEPDELRGNRFIGSTNFFNKNIKRECSTCRYRFNEDCVGYKIKEIFGIPENEIMPHTLNGKPIGNYCEGYAERSEDE